jgi:alanine dehydrogenase
MQYYDHPEEGIDLAAVNEAVEAVFAAHGRGEVQMPPKLYLSFQQGDLRTMPAYIPSLNLSGVKIVNVHPGNRTIGLPTVMALLVLIDPANGYPRALLNATGLTDLRTGAAGAVAARYLARTGATVVGMVGAGRQAKAQIEALACVRTIKEVKVWSRSPEHATAFAAIYPQYHARSLPLTEVCDCDILVTTTPSTTPIIQEKWIRAGTHINAIGADAPGKEELDPALLNHAAVYVDDLAQAVHSGEVNVPISQHTYAVGAISGTIGEVILGKKGRIDDRSITVFDSTGLAVQDLAIAEVALRTGGQHRTELPFP